MNHVTYLLGAGASHPTLPLNDGLLNSIKGYITVGRNHDTKIINQQYLNLFESNYMPIIEQAEKQLSLDTLARMNLNDKNKLHKIKTLIWMYFSTRAGRGSVDPRYINLLLKIGKIGNNGYHLNEGFSFLSWNYDLQLEEAFSILNNSDLLDSARNIYSYPALAFTNPELMDRNSNPPYFKLLHLNGLAGYYYSDLKNKYLPFYNCDITQPDEYNRLLSLIVQEFHTNSTKINALHNCINFVGEEGDINRQKISYTENLAMRTTHLVIIGYSLPDFNRTVDRRFIERMPNLRYVCIQDPNAGYIKTRLENGFNKFSDSTFKRVQIHLETNTKEFHFPHDL